MTRKAALVTFLTGCLAGCSPSPPEESSSEKTSPLANGSFSADLGGFSIHYQVHGSGPVLMTVPNSWGLTLEGLRGLYRGLEEHFTLVYFDPRGMGQSGPIREETDMGKAAVRADFDALRRHLQLDRVNAIGWSNGAMNLILLASERPETLSSAIFLHGVARFSTQDMQNMAASHSELFQRYEAFQQEMNNEELTAAERDSRVKRFDLEEWFPHMLADPEATRQRMAQAFDAAGFGWRHSQYANVDPPDPFDTTEDLRKITARSLVIAGRHDMLPPEKAQEIHDGIRDSTFFVFGRSGHFAPLEEPELFVETVVNFLGS